jgi:type I restriction enzyme S subunit
MSEWKEIELGEVADVQTGPFGSQLKNEQYITGGTPVVTVEHIQDFRIIDFDYPSITDEDKDRLSKYLMKEGDILFTRVGSVDLSAYVSKGQDGWMFSSRMLRVRPNKEINSRFLSYFFQQKSFRDYIINIAVGATMPSINTGILKTIPISYPPLTEQKEIAEVLSSLDDKIDLLHRQNQTLEQMAETLFRQWFVEEFDNANYVKLGKLVNTVDNRGKTPPWSEEKTEYPLIEVNALGNRLVDYSKIKKYVDEETFTTWFRAHPKKYDTLLSTVGSIGEFSMFIEEYGSIAQNVVAFRAKGISPFYLYQTLKFFSRDIKEFDIGSVQPSIKVSHLREYEIPVCTNSENLKEFDKISLDICSKLETNQTQIVTLTALRDTLLPKLMSGALSLSNCGEVRVE